LWACEMLLPNCGPFPQTSHICAIVLLPILDCFVLPQFPSAQISIAQCRSFDLSPATKTYRLRPRLQLQERLPLRMTASITAQSDMRARLNAPPAACRNLSIPGTSPAAKSMPPGRRYLRAEY
jgi:hypothetical protein